jgi:putative holliday junction resolvase
MSATQERGGMSGSLPERGRLLAIDLGEVRIGLALSDPTQTIASPAETLQVPRNQDGPTLDALVNAVDRHEVSGIVIGEPKQLDGSTGDPAKRARWFAERLRARTGLPVVLWDERFSTTEAERVMLAQDASRADRRANIDRVAASVLLQSVLESQRRGRTEP